MNHLQAPHPVRGNLAYLAAFLMDLTFSSGMVALSYLAKDKFEVDLAGMGLFALLGASVYMAATWLFGRLSDHWGRRANIVIGCAINVAGYAAYPFVGALWQLYALLMWCAFGQAAFWPAIEADISDHSPRGELSRRLGRFNLAWGLGFIVGSVGGGVAGRRYGYSAVFVAAAAFSAAAVLAHAFRRFGPVGGAAREAGEGPRAEASAGLADLLWKAGLLLNFATTGLAATIRWQMPSVIRRSDLGGLFLAAFFVAQFTSFAVLGRWHGWRYRAWPLGLGCVLAAGGALACGVSGGGPGLLGGGCLLAGLGCGVSYNLSLYYSVAAATGVGHRGGIHEAVLAGGGAVIPYAGGWLAQWAAARQFGALSAGLAHLLAGCVVLLAGGAALLAVLRSQRPAGAKAGPASPADAV